MSFPPDVRAALLAFARSNVDPAAVQSWLEAIAPDLGLTAESVEGFFEGLDAATADGAAGDLGADIAEYLLTLRRQMTSLAGLFDVQACEILRQNGATNANMVKAHVQTAEQFRKHLDTLRDAQTETSAKGGTVADLFAALIKSRRG